MEGYQTLLILFIVYLAGFLLYQTLRVRNKKSNSLWYCIGIFISTVIYQLHLR